MSEAVVRAKFTIHSITQYEWDRNNREIILKPQYDKSLEDRSFVEATPSGELKMYVNNPRAVEELFLGRAFYLDFIPVDGE